MRRTTQLPLRQMLPQAHPAQGNRRGLGLPWCRGTIHFVPPRVHVRDFGRFDLPGKSAQEEEQGRELLGVLDARLKDAA